MSNERRGVLLVLAAALLWSTGGLGIKAVPEPPLKVAFFRSVVAAVALSMLLRPRLLRPSPPFVVAVMAYAATLTTFVTAVKWTTAANAILLQYSGIIWVVLLSALILKERPHWRDLVAVGVGFVGMLLFFVQQLEAKGTAGNLMALLSSLCFAALILSLRLERGVRAEAAVTWGNVLLSAALFPVVAQDLHLAPRSALILLLLGVFQIAVPYALFVRGLRYVTATEASLTGMIEPIANPFWVFLFLGERPDITAIVGGAIVLVAVAWRTLTAPAARPAEVPAPD